MDGKVYVVGGGYLNRAALSDKLFIYDFSTKSWVEGANLPSPRGALTANFVNGIMYAVGGVNSTGTLTSNLAYDPATNTWTEKAPMPTAREHLASAVVDDKLYVIGGRSEGMSANVNSNEVYDPKTDSWTLLEPMPSNRGGLASSAINQTVYVFGGKNLPEHLIAMKAMISRLTSGRRNWKCQRRDTAWSLLLMMIKYMLSEAVQILEVQGAV
jgi:hypothetical protein